MNRIVLAFVSLVSAATGFGLAHIVPPSNRPDPTSDQVRSLGDVSGRSINSPTAKPSSPEAATANGTVSNPAVCPLILERLLPDLSEEELESLVVAGMRSDEHTQLSFLAAFLAGENPFLHDLFRKIASSHVALVEASLDAFDREENRDRKMILAEVFGGLPLHPRVLARGRDILAGTDARMQLHLLQNWNVRFIPENDREHLSIRLRELVIHSDLPELKLAAIHALNDEDSDTGVRFFLDRILHDTSPEVRLAALKGLPWNLGGNQEIRNEISRGLYAALSGPSAGPGLSKRIARRLRSYWEDRTQTLFTSEEWERIERVADGD